MVINVKTKLKKGKIFLFFIGVILLFLVVLPPLSPLLFDDTTQRGALRNELYELGYPYQSYFAVITQQDSSSDLFHMYWIPWKDETGSRPFVCYSKKVNDEKYNVSCGTGP